MEAHSHDPARLNVFVLHQQLGDVPSKEKFRAAYANASATQCSSPGVANDYILVGAPERLSYPMDRSTLVFIDSDIFISGYKRIADKTAADGSKDPSSDIEAFAAEKAIQKVINTAYDIYLSDLAISACQVSVDYDH